MKTRLGWLSLAVVGILFAGTAHAQITSMVTHERVFNDFPGSTLVTTNTGTVNQGFALSAASIAETNYIDDMVPGNFANRHDFILSRDGVNDHYFDIDDSWKFSAIVNLAGSNPPAKEAGLRINDAVTGDALFFVKTNGEIVLCCGGAPFQLPSGGSGPDYVPGTPILLELTMDSPGDGVGGAANRLEIHVDYTPGVPGGDFSSGLLPFSNLELGPLHYTLGLYGQIPPSGPTDTVNILFNDVRFVPEPTTAMMSIVGVLGLLIRRRSR